MIKKETMQFLTDLATEMAIQSNRGTQNVGFMVAKQKKNGDHTTDDRAGVFLTAKACEEHIKYNKYHYSNPTSFGISFWRNDEMVQLINAIFEITGIKKPNHYS